MKTYFLRTRRLRRLSILAIAALALSGCAATTTGTATSTTTLADLGHVHGFSVDAAKKQTLVATHNGVWRLDSGYLTGTKQAKPAVRVGANTQDTMGFTAAGPGRMFASGHPDPENNPKNDPTNLGLIVSRDSARTWKTVSLKGQTDFHDLVAIPEAGDASTVRIYGYDSSRQTITASADSGRTWTDGAKLALRDLAANTAVPTTVYATTKSGLQVSYDSGNNFSIVGGAPSLYLIDPINIGPGGFAGVDIDGAIWTTVDGGVNWTQRGRFTAPPEAFMQAAGASKPWILGTDDRGIVATPDYGTTWITLLPEKP